MHHRRYRHSCYQNVVHKSRLPGIWSIWANTHLLTKPSQNEYVTRAIPKRTCHLGPLTTHLYKPATSPPSKPDQTLPEPAQTFHPPKSSLDHPKPTNQSMQHTLPTILAHRRGWKTTGFHMFSQFSKSSVQTFCAVLPGKLAKKKVCTDRVSRPDRCKLFWLWFYPVKVPKKFAPIAVEKTGAD